MPIPVSVIQNSSRASDGSSCCSVIESMTVPRSVNLIALLSRLIKICCSLSASPIKLLGTLGATAMLKPMRFSFALSANRLLKLSSMASRSMALRFSTSQCRDHGLSSYCRIISPVLWRWKLAPRRITGGGWRRHTAMKCVLSLLSM